MSEVVLVSAARTPIGAFQGALRGVGATELGGIAIKAALERAGCAADEVIMGNVLSAGLGQAPARQAALRAGVSDSVPCITVNKVCGSGMAAIMLGAQSIQLGEAGVVVAGGMENMSQAPFLIRGAREGWRMGEQRVEDSMIVDGLWDPYNNQHMGMCAEQCAKKYAFTREQQDAYATQSFRRAQQAVEDGLFREEIAPVEISDKRKGTTTVAVDEGPGRAQFDKMAGLRPAFDPAGTITAANASTLNDGAAAVVLMSAEQAKATGRAPLARIAGSARFSQAPLWFTTSPIGAINNLLKKVGWSVGDVDLFEINEAFAVVAMAAQQEPGISADKLNVHGGAIALGHPIGASGARLVVTLLHALRQRNAKRGIASLCIGGGEATALAIELV